MQHSPNTVFKAVAHPARRRIIDLLSRSPCTVKELTASFAMSQPAVSQHLRELRDAGLVASETFGLEHRYRLIASPLRQVFEWTAQYKHFFDPSGHAWSFTPAAPEPKQPIGGKTKGGPRNGS